jgi:hypothetical protein
MIENDVWDVFTYYDVRFIQGDCTHFSSTTLI